MRKVTATLACVLWVLVLLGCGGFQQMAADQAKRKQTLQEIGTAYRAAGTKTSARGRKKPPIWRNS